MRRLCGNLINRDLELGDGGAGWRLRYRRYIFIYKHDVKNIV